MTQWSSARQNIYILQTPVLKNDESKIWQFTRKYNIGNVFVKLKNVSHISFHRRPHKGYDEYDDDYDYDVIFGLGFVWNISSSLTEWSRYLGCVTLWWKIKRTNEVQSDKESTDKQIWNSIIRMRANALIILQNW